LGIGLVADHGGHAGVRRRPVLLLGRTHDGSHVGAAARDQDHDVFHFLRIIPAMPFDHRAQPLTPHAARVLATLMEKPAPCPTAIRSRSTAWSGCNQKTSRAR
jgi:hypothetical protein